jgi:hypothetical protein
LFEVAVGRSVGELGRAESSDPLVEQVELTVQSCGDQLILRLGPPPGARLRSSVSDKVLLLQSFNWSDLVKERSAFLGN